MRTPPVPPDEPRDEGSRASYGIVARPVAGGPREGRARRLVPALVVTVGVVIVVAGLLGPKGDGQPVSPATPAPLRSEPVSRTAPSATPDVSPSAQPSAAPALVVTGPPLADPFVLLGGRWVDLRTSTAQETGCGHGQLLVLTGGRIVCILESSSRPLGASDVTLTLTVSTFGQSGTDPAAAPPGSTVADPTVGRAIPFMKLKGRADVTTVGEPAAAVVTAGADQDAFLVAWAVLERDGYRLGLDSYRLSGPDVLRDQRIALARIQAAGIGDIGLGDLAVSLAPDGRHALVGISAWAPPPGWGWPVRRLWVATLGPGEPGSAVALPTGVAPGDIPCGGSTQEGVGTDGSFYLVCNDGGALLLRRFRIDSPNKASLIGETRVDAGGVPGVRLDGTTVVDRAHGLWYRWMPVVHRLVRFDLAHDGKAAVLDLPPDGGPDPRDPSNQPGPPRFGDPPTHPLLALAPDGRRAYLLGLPPDMIRELGGRGPGVDVVDTRSMTPLERWIVDPPQTTGVVLSADGRLAYLSSDSSGGPPGGRTIELVVRDTRDGTSRLIARRLPAGIDDPLLPLIVR